MTESFEKLVFEEGFTVDTGGERTRILRRDSDLTGFILGGCRLGTLASTSPRRSAMKASSSTVFTGCGVQVSQRTIPTERRKGLTFGLGALAAAVALKYLLMLWLVRSVFSRSSSRFLLATELTHQCRSTDCQTKVRTSFASQRLLLVALGLINGSAFRVPVFSPIVCVAFAIVDDNKVLLIKTTPNHLLISLFVNFFVKLLLLINLESRQSCPSRLAQSP